MKSRWKGDGIRLWPLILLSAAAWAADPAGWESLYKDDFGGGEVTDWRVAGSIGSAPSWMVAEDEGNWVYAGRGYGRAALDAGRWTDFRVRFRVKIQTQSVHFHYRYGACDSYRLTLTSAQQTLNRMRSCSPLVRVAESREALAPGQWHTVEMTGTGAALQVALNGRPAITLTDPTPVLAGSVAFSVDTGAAAAIDDLEITGVPDPSSRPWVRTGGPLGGVGYDIRMRPGEPDTMYVTDAYTGVSISRDGGRTWQRSSRGIINRSGSSGDAIPIFSLTIDPKDPDTIWIGTQNQRGIYKSTDGGRNWVLKDRGIAEGNGLSIRGFGIDPRDSNVVYAAGQVGSISWAGQILKGRSFDRSRGVVYKTTDGGENWRRVWQGEALARYVWIDPRRPDTVYVSTGFWDVESANTEAERGEPGGLGVLKSADGGESWTVLGRQNGLLGLYVGSLAMDPSNPDRLLAGVGSNAWKDYSGVYLSQDGGDTWARTLAKKFPGASGPVAQEDASMIYSVEFASGDPSVAYAVTTATFYRSTDGGRTWSVTSGPAHAHWGPAGVAPGPATDLETDPRDSNRIFANTYTGGNFLSEDGGRTWVDASVGYTGAETHGLAVDPTDHRRVYVAGRSGGYRSDDGGRTWSGLNDWGTPVQIPGKQIGGVPNGLGNQVALDPSDPSRVLYADEYTGTVLRSLQSGLDLRVVFSHPGVPVPSPGPSDAQGFKALAFSPSDSAIVFAGIRHDRNTMQSGNIPPSFGVFKSTDRGETWQEANDAQTARLNVSALAVDPRSSDIVYAGTAEAGVLGSADGGVAWRQMGAGLRTRDVRALAIDPADPFTLYAGMWRGGIYKSTDAGGVWQPLLAGIEAGASILSIVIDPKEPQVLYAGDYHSGVYRSVDGGKTWLAINRNLTMRTVTALAISSDGGTLYAATEGEGVFRLDVKPLER